LKTLTFAVVAVAMRALLTVAWIWVALLTLVPLNVVCVPPALHNTCEACVGLEFITKLVPVTVKENAALPATAQVGDNEETVGTGFPGGLMMNAIGFESPLVPAPECGLSVLTNAVPALATRDAGTVAVIPMTLPPLSVCSCVGIVPPFHCTTVLATNPVPGAGMTVKVKLGLPAAILAGDSAVMVAPVGTWNVFP
jgi:hypothetical protein